MFCSKSAKVFEVIEEVRKHTGRLHWVSRYSSSGVRSGAEPRVAQTLCKVDARVFKQEAAMLVVQ